MDNLMKRSTVELLEDAQDIFLELERRNKEISNTLSFLDTRVSEIYHKVEIENFSASKGYEISRELQRLLRMRRVIKRDQSSFGLMERKASRQFIGGNRWMSIKDYLHSVLVTYKLSEIDANNRIYAKEHILGKETYYNIETLKDSNI